jgi:uncharacterized RDD family membrane protein YckC
MMLFGVAVVEPERNPYAAPDSSSVVETSLPEFDHSPLGGRWTRLFAVWLDGLLYIAVIFPGIIICGSDEVIAVFDGSIEIEPLLWVGVPLLGALAYQWRLLTLTGQTLGKKWLGLRVVRVDGSRASFVQVVLLRVWLLQVLTYIPLVGNFIAFLDAIMIFGAERRCLHDRIAGTIVVRAAHH